MTGPTDYTYYQLYFPGAGETRGGVKTLLSVKPYLAGDPWFVRVTFQLYSLTDTRWKPLVGSFYTNTDGIDNWGLWISPSNLLHFRVGGAQVELQTSTVITEVNTWYEAFVSRNSDGMKIGIKSVYNDAISNTVTTFTSYFSININQASAVVTVGGWQNRPSEGFPGVIETVTIGQYFTNMLINDIIPSPVQKGSVTSIYLQGSIGYGYTITSSLYSSNPNLVRIDPVLNTNTGYHIYALDIGSGSVYIQCIVLDPNGFYPPINTSYTLTVTKSSATLTVSQSAIVVKYVLNSIFSFDVFGTNNTDSNQITRTYSSGSPSVGTISNSSIANAQIAGVGSSLISVTQSETTNFSSVTGSNILTLVIVGQGGSYSSINMTSLDLSGTNLSTTTFNNCNLTGVNLYGVTVNSSTNFTGSNLSNVQSGRILGNTTLLPSGYQLL